MKYERLETIANFISVITLLIFVLFMSIPAIFQTYGGPAFESIVFPYMYIAPVFTFTSIILLVIALTIRLRKGLFDKDFALAVLITLTAFLLYLPFALDNWFSRSAPVIEIENAIEESEMVVPAN